MLYIYVYTYIYMPWVCAIYIAKFIDLYIHISGRFMRFINRKARQYFPRFPTDLDLIKAMCICFFIVIHNIVHGLLAVGQFAVKKKC